MQFLCRYLIWFHHRGTESTEFLPFRHSHENGNPWAMELASIGVIIGIADLVPRHSRMWLAGVLFILRSRLKAYRDDEVVKTAN